MKLRQNDGALPAIFDDFIVPILAIGTLDFSCGVSSTFLATPHCGLDHTYRGICICKSLGLIRLPDPISLSRIGPRGHPLSVGRILRDDDPCDDPAWHSLGDVENFPTVGARCRTGCTTWTIRLRPRPKSSVPGGGGRSGCPKWARRASLAPGLLLRSFPRR